MKKIIMSLVLVAAPVFAAAQSWQGFFSLGGYYADVRGFMQTPIGGKPGTSSEHRPYFSELGVGHVKNMNLDLGVKWQAYTFSAAYQRIRPSGSATLKQSLKSHGRLIPAGTQVSTSNIFDWYHFGVSRAFGVTSKWQLSPELQGAMLNFSFHLTPPEKDATRAFHAFTVRLGLNSDYQLTSKLGWQVALASSVPGLLNLTIVTASTQLQYTVSQTQHVNTQLFLGAGYESIQYRDKQAMPNDEHLILSPYATVGVSFRFD